jgi:SAM-dependent methyltransferase
MATTGYRNWLSKWFPGPPGNGHAAAPPAADAPPYPGRVARRHLNAEGRPSDGGVECFDTPAALAINRGRLDHLAGLGLPLAGKTVLDVGCGVGHLAQFFVKRGCKVTCVDGRAENVASLRQRYPGLDAHVADVQRDPLARLGTFDVVLCYGLLYHLEDPLGGLRNVASAVKEVLLLETVVTDCSQPVLTLVDEPSSFNQTLAAMGCRPSPGYVAMALNRVGFPHVYGAVEPPDHPDFRFAWKDNLDHGRDGNLLRCIFVAARQELNNPRLKSLLS